MIVLACHMLSWSSPTPSPLENLYCIKNEKGTDGLCCPCFIYSNVQHKQTILLYSLYISIKDIQYNKYNAEIHFFFLSFSINDVFNKLYSEYAPINRASIQCCNFVLFFFSFSYFCLLTICRLQSLGVFVLLYYIAVGIYIN